MFPIKALLGSFVGHSIKSSREKAKDEVILPLMDINFSLKLEESVVTFLQVLGISH